MNCPHCGDEQFTSSQPCLRCGFTQPSLNPQATFVMPGHSSEVHPLPTQPAPSRSSPSLIQTSLHHRKEGVPGMALQGNHYLLVEQQEKQQWSPEVSEIWWFAQDMESRGDVHICEVVLPLSGSTMQTFYRSAAKALLAQSNSPRMPQLLNVFMEHGQCFFVFTHPVGESLHERIQQEGMISEKEAIDCYLQGAATLFFLSEQDPAMVHGAIEPNHLVKVGMNWVFTNASILMAAGGTHFISSSPIPTPASDLSALTATIYYALTGIIPPSDTRMRHEQLMHLQLSSAFSAALLKGLHPDVQVRYRHPTEIIKALGAKSNQSERIRHASSSRVLGSTQPDQKPDRSTVVMPHAVAPSPPPMRSQGQEGILLLQGGNLSSFPQSLDTLVAMVWTLGILLCTLIFLLIAR
jgi:hypothetical protein